MKTFEQLNDGELVTLTQEQIDEYIKLKKAEQGIKILVMPTYPAIREIPEPETTVYEVAGYSFLTPEPAQEICEIINKHASKQRECTYDWNINRDTYYEKPKSYISMESVSIKKVFSQEKFQEIKDILKSNKLIKDSYEKVKEEYDEENEKASEIIENIYEQIQKAKDRIEIFREYKLRIVDYIKLANGDTNIAWNFFDKAYVVEPSVKNMIMESEEYQDAIKSYINA